MSTHLDLDDVCAGHPLAQRELAALRAEVAGLRAALRGLMVGCKYCNIQGQWHWHEKAIASNEALDAARAALAARTGEAMP